MIAFAILAFAFVLVLVLVMLSIYDARRQQNKEFEAIMAKNPSHYRMLRPGVVLAVYCDTSRQYLPDEVIDELMKMAAGPMKAPNRHPIPVGHHPYLEIFHASDEQVGSYRVLSAAGFELSV